MTVEVSHILPLGVDHWMRREVDEDMVARPELIVVDDFERAKNDLVWPEARGGFGWNLARELLWWRGESGANPVGVQ